jgi:hypothetical protein
MEVAMLKSILTFVVAACVAAGAQAQTFAEVVFTHLHQFRVTPTGNVPLQDMDIDLRFRVEGDRSNDSSFSVGVGGLRNGETTVTVYDYTMTLFAVARPYTGPRSTYCAFISFESVCIGHFGVEEAFAQIKFGHIDPRGANPFLNLQGTQTSQRAIGRLDIGGSPLADTQIVESGQLSARIGTSDEERLGGASFNVLVFLNTFATPIPEVSTFTSMVAGLALLAAARWRRRAGHPKA